MVGPHDGEVAVVQRGQASDIETLGDGDQAGIGPTKSEIGLGFDELADALPVLMAERLHDEITLDDRAVSAASACGPSWRSRGKPLRR